MPGAAFSNVPAGALSSSLAICTARGADGSPPSPTLWALGLEMDAVDAARRQAALRDTSGKRSG